MGSGRKQARENQGQVILRNITWRRVYSSSFSIWKQNQFNKNWLRTGTLKSQTNSGTSRKLNLPVPVWGVHGDCPWSLGKSLVCHKGKTVPNRFYVLVWVNSHGLKDTLVLPCAVGPQAFHLLYCMLKIFWPMIDWFLTFHFCVHMQFGRLGKFHLPELINY